MNDKMPKLLIVSLYAPPIIGAPQNMYILLRDWPRERLAVITSFYNIDNLSAQKGRWLSAKYFFYDNPGASRETRQAAAASQSKGISGIRSLVSSLKYLAKRVPAVKATLGPFVIFGQIFMVLRASLGIIREWNPDFIVGFSDYGPAMIGSYLAHRITKKPWAMFLFDLYRGNNYPFPGNQLAAIFEPRMMRDAYRIIVTNEGAKEWYSKRYGPAVAQKIVVVHNTIPGIPNEKYLRLQTPYDPKPPYTILFTGGIYWPQIRSIKNLIAALKDIDLDIVFHIYTINPKEYLAKIGISDGPRVAIHSAVPPDEMPEIQSRADILFLPLSWGTPSPAIIDTATPGKLTDYLISGRPILIHAPPTTYLVRYAKENSFAIVVEREDIEELKMAIRKLIFDKDFSRRIIENAKSTYLRNHDEAKNAALFRSIFI